LEGVAVALSVKDGFCVDVIVFVIGTVLLTLKELVLVVEAVDVLLGTEDFVGVGLVFIVIVGGIDSVDVLVCNVVLENVGVDDDVFDGNEDELMVDDAVVVFELVMEPVDVFVCIVVKVFLEVIVYVDDEDCVFDPGRLLEIEGDDDLVLDWGGVFVNDGLADWVLLDIVVELSVCELRLVGVDLEDELAVLLSCPEFDDRGLELEVFDIVGVFVVVMLLVCVFVLVDDFV
jgi:hypothetical protein